MKRLHIQGNCKHRTSDVFRPLLEPAPVADLPNAGALMAGAAVASRAFDNSLVASGVESDAAEKMLCLDLGISS